MVEVYSGHGHPGHATTTPVTNGRSAHNTRSQVVDPAQLTSLDFENEGTRAQNMIVQDPPSPAHSHDLNHNQNHLRLKPPGSSSKYLVQESSSGGEDNYAYEGSPHRDNYVQENYGYDPGYSSERSPEDEEGPPIFRNSSSRSPSSSPQPSERPASLMLAPGEVLSTQQLQRLCPFIRESTSFEVCVVKNLRGLGLAVTGGVECEVPWAGLIRIKKLYPQTPAWLCGQLRIGDIVLSANSQPLTGLQSHEALEVLRTAGTEVTMQLCRPDFGDMDENSDVLDGVNCGIPVVSTSLTAPTQTHNHLSPSPSLSAYGEFEVSLTKVAGSLGFTLRKNDNSILGHTIRSLVKEPAISNGNLRAGDKIISVNNRDMCSLTHEEAIGFLRTCPETVTLKLYRDAMQTPVSPVSPCEPEMIHKPKPLRKEARDMLEDLAFRKQSPCNSPSLNNTSSPGTPRRRRLQKTPSPDLKSVDRWDSLVRKTCEDTSLPGSPTLDSQLSLKSIQESDYEDSPFSDSCYNDASGHAVHALHSRTSSASSNSYSASETERPIRPTFLDLSRGQSCSRKTEFTPPHERDLSFPPSPSSQYPSHHLHSQTPAHGLTSTHSDTHPTFSHHTPGYSSVNLGGLPGYSSVNLGSQAHTGGRSMTNTTSDHNLSGHPHGGVDEADNGLGLLKWKGIVFTPEEEDCQSLERNSSDEYSERTDEIDQATSPQNNIVTVKLNRGWNSRLGFSLQPQENGQTIITAIYADSVAAKDGRLHMGDRVVRVNGINCEEMSTEEIIDILRKTRGAISLGVLQESH